MRLVLITSALLLLPLAGCGGGSDTAAVETVTVSDSKPTRECLSESRRAREVWNASNSEGGPAYVAATRDSLAACGTDRAWRAAFLVVYDDILDMARAWSDDGEPDALARGALDAACEEADPNRTLPACTGT